MRHRNPAPQFPPRLALLFTALLALLLAAPPAGAAEAADFSGGWSTTFGEMTLEQAGARVTGHYEMGGVPCLVDGTVAGRRLTFTYREPSVTGEGWFELAPDGASFDGRWREKGAGTWSRWRGERGKAAAATFAGLWNASYGPLRLWQAGDKATGFYRMADGPFAEVAGTVTGSRLDFAYDECGVTGSGAFTLGASGDSFAGEWKSDAGEGGAWTGARIVPKPGRVWLVTLEARWEDSLAEREYSYGEMLKAYFARTPHVECRHRFFDDGESLARACAEIPFLPEPVVVVLASHGLEEGITVGNHTLDGAELARCFARAGNLTLLHFSACLAMEGTLPVELAGALPAGVAFPMSGYTTSVDWGATVSAEFIYLDAVLARGMAPADAARALLAAMPAAGARTPAGSPFPALGFRFRPAGK